MAYGTVNADVIGTSVAGSNLGAGNASIMKNRIINGAMQIWQRGTTSTAIGYQTADRWSFYADSSRTVAQSTDVPSGFTYSASLSGTGSTGFTQKIESVNTIGLVGNSITISFWLKQTTGAGTNAIALNLYYPTAVDNYSATTQIGSTVNFTTTTGWVQYTATFNSLPSGVSNGIQLTIVTTSGSAVVFLLTGVQLEVGSSATGFEYVNYQTSLANCQRYYWKNSGSSQYLRLGIGPANQTTSASITINMQIPMRSAPTSVTTTGSFGLWTGATVFSVTAGSFALDSTSSGIASTVVTMNSSGLTTGTTYQLIGNSDSTAAIALSAEL